MNTTTVGAGHNAKRLSTPATMAGFESLS